MDEDPFLLAHNLSAHGSPSPLPGPKAAWAGSVLLLALVGNALVLRGVCGCQPRRRRDLLLGHLALADLAGCGLALLPRLAAELREAAGSASPTACRLLPLLQRCGPLASAHGLVLVALERHRPALPARGLAALGWLLAPLLALPQAFAFRPAPRPSGTRCRSVFEELPLWHGLAFAVYGAATGFLAPAGLLSWACARSLATLGAARRQQGRRRRGRGELPGAGSGGWNFPRKRGRAQPLRLPLVLVALFALCRLPHCALEIGLASAPGDGGGRQEALAAAGIVAATNSALNPFACLLLHSRLRRGLCGNSTGSGTATAAAACCCSSGTNGQGRRGATLRRPLRRRAGNPRISGTESNASSPGIPGSPGTCGSPSSPGTLSCAGTPGSPSSPNRSVAGVPTTAAAAGAALTKSRCQRGVGGMARRNSHPDNEQETGLGSVW